MNTEKDLPPIDPVQAHVAHCTGCPTCDNWRELLSTPRTTSSDQPNTFSFAGELEQVNQMHRSTTINEVIANGSAIPYSAKDLDKAQKARLQTSLLKIGIVAPPRFGETHLEYLNRVETLHPEAIQFLVSPLADQDG